MLQSKAGIMNKSRSIRSSTSGGSMSLWRSLHVHLIRRNVIDGRDDAVNGGLEARQKLRQRHGAGGLHEAAQLRAVNTHDHAGRIDLLAGGGVADAAHGERHLPA